MKTLLSIAGILLATACFQIAHAQERTTDRIWQSPNAAVTQTIGLTEIHITYGRPSVRGRVIFGDLVPYGEVWRTGANESTVIIFSDDVKIAGDPVPAGTYSLYTIPGVDTWTIILNHKLSWGTQYDSEEDFLRVEARPEKSQHMEQMMLYFENVTDHTGDLIIHWDDVKVSVPIETPLHSDN